jgi:exoribonuclease R
LLSEVEGVVEGHRDGHGFVRRDDGQPQIYLSPQEMRAVLHRDRVRARIVRYDRKGRPEGRVVDILERRKAPIIGRLLHEAGIWLVAPEDKRYGQDIMVPKNAIADAAVGQVVSIERLKRRVGATMQVLVDQAPALGRKGGVGRSYADAPEIDGIVRLLPPEKASKTFKVGDFTRARIVGTQGHDLLAVPI